jgi:hypothetical protein
VSEVPFPFAFQTLGKAIDQVLLAASILGMRNGNGLFNPPSLLQFFDALRVPRPTNIHRDLKDLERDHLLRRIGRLWAVTPVGRRSVEEELQLFDLAELDAYLKGTPGSFLGNERHVVIPPELAPPKWIPAIERLLQKFPFETNVFLITRFPQSESDTTYLDPLRSAIPAIENTLHPHGLTLHLASERQLDDDLLGNVAAHMWACQFGIGILEDRVGRGLNYNVMTEIGAMLMTGRRCALMKDKTSPTTLPTDVIGQIYKPIDLDDIASLSSIIHRWASEDLALGRCNSCPS